MALTARIRILVLSQLLLCLGTAWAAPRRALDRVRIHALYHDGEFERILRELEPYGKGQCACAKDDSIFAEKHLAVVLAAAPATRELGRYHMFRLLDLSPRADLLDMYVGDEVDAVFEKVRKEHALRAADPAAAKAPARSMAINGAPASPAAPASKAAPAAPSSGPAYSDAWAKAAASGARPAYASRPVPASRPAARYTPWDAPLAVRSARATAVDPAPAQAPSGTAVDSSTTLTASGTSEVAAAARPGTEAAGVSEADSSRSVWKQPGMWIGGGAAIAAIAFTLWHAGSESGGPGKTYAVPASLSK